MGLMLASFRAYMCDHIKRKSNPNGKTAGEELDDGDDWEDESSEEEGVSNANEEQSAEKDKALTEQYPIDDVKMMLAVRTDLGMTKGKIGAQCGHATMGAYHTSKKWAQTS